MWTRGPGAAAACGAEAGKFDTGQTHTTGSICLGGVIGWLLAYPCGAVVGMRPDYWLLLGLPLAVATGVLLFRWVQAGPLPGWLLGLPLLVWAVNLLAAGGISFAGVAQTGWLLMALALNRSEWCAAEGQGATPATGSRHIVPYAASALLAILCLGAYYLTMYNPFLRCEMQLALGTDFAAQKRWAEAAAAYRGAAAADVYSAEPWVHLAALYQQRALVDSSTDARLKFEQAVAELTRLRRHSQATWRQLGDWRLALYRASGDRTQLVAAIAAYAESVRLYPTSNLAHAQLAWAQHAAGNREAAQEEAGEALRLDACLQQHRERRLSAQRIYEPQLAGQVEETAEQCMQRLRN